MWANKQNTVNLFLNDNFKNYYCLILRVEQQFFSLSNLNLFIPAILILLALQQKSMHPIHGITILGWILIFVTRFQKLYLILYVKALIKCWFLILIKHESTSLCYRKSLHKAKYIYIFLKPINKYIEQKVLIYFCIFWQYLGKPERNNLHNFYKIYQ